MLTPEFLLHATEGAEEIASMLYTEILTAIVRRIMARLDFGADYLLTASDKWQIQTLQEAGFLIEDIQKQIAKRTGQELSEIKKAFKSAGVQTLAYDDAIYRDAGLSPKPLNQSPNLIRILERNFEQTAGTWNNLTRTTANAAQQQFIQTCDKALNLVNSGAMPLQQAVMNAIDDLARNGINNVAYGSGRNESIEVATLRAVRTGINQTAAEVSLERMDDMEWDIILVSSHLGARNVEIAGIPYANHESWQGKFYSRTGKDKRFPDFESSTGYGTGEGLCGWNCRHSFGSGDGIHNSFEDFDSEENKKRYELEQDQRKIERKIREYKKRYAVYSEALKADPNNPDLQKRVDATKDKLVNLNTEYRAFCKNNGLRPLENRLKTGEYLTPTKKAQNTSQNTQYMGNIVQDNVKGNGYSDDIKYGSVDVTDIWTKNPSDKPITSYMKEYTVDGITYKVDGVKNKVVHINHEKENAESLSMSTGKEVEFVPDIYDEKGNPRPAPDFMFDGFRLENKEITVGTGKHPVYDAIHKKLYQAHNFVIDRRTDKITYEQLLEHCKYVFTEPRTGVVERLFVMDNGVLKNVLERIK